MFSPCLASSFAYSFPMPSEAPVTTTEQNNVQRHQLKTKSLKREISLKTKYVSSPRVELALI